jgi:hypothetical protein
LTEVAGPLCCHCRPAPQPCGGRNAPAIAARKGATP